MYKAFFQNPASGFPTVARYAFGRICIQVFGTCSNERVTFKTLVQGTFDEYHAAREEGLSQDLDGIREAFIDSLKWAGQFDGVYFRTLDDARQALIDAGVDGFDLGEWTYVSKKFD